MDQELAKYVTANYSELMTSTEKVVDRHLSTTFKTANGRSDAPAQAAVWSAATGRRRWLSDDPEILALAADGLEAFRQRTAQRILAEHAGAVFLNRCPECRGLARTPRAQLCIHCGHAWHSASSR